MSRDTGASYPGLISEAINALTARVIAIEGNIARLATGQEDTAKTHNKITAQLESLVTAITIPSTVATTTSISRRPQFEIPGELMNERPETSNSVSHPSLRMIRPAPDYVGAQRELKEGRVKTGQAVPQMAAVEHAIEKIRRTPFASKEDYSRLTNPIYLGIPSYDGAGDPTSYLVAVQTTVDRLDLDESEQEEAHFRIFTEHLSGPALLWCAQLEQESVRSFKDLSSAFLNKYSTSFDARTSDADLWSVTQGPHNSLREYISRFKGTIAKMPGISNLMAISALKHGLRYDSGFREELVSNRPETIQNALLRADSWIQAEESKGSGKIKTAQVTIEPKTQTTDRKSESKEQRSRHLGVNPRSSNIAKTSCERKKKLASTWIRDVNAYCEIHEIKGHATKHCGILKRHLAELWASGNLASFAINEFIARHHKVGEGPDESPGSSGQAKTIKTVSIEKPEQRVNVILRGSESFDSSAHKVEKRQRMTTTSISQMSFAQASAISFEEKDTAYPSKPNDGALVITLDVANFEVKNVLIDTGGSANLIFLRTLERMGISRKEIIGTPSPFTAFSNETSMSLGVIKLPILAADVPVIVEFTVFDAPSPYNIILGTPWIYKMKAVPSPYHQCVKFPSSEGVKTIHGNRQAARKNSHAIYELQ